MPLRLLGSSVRRTHSSPIAFCILWAVACSSANTQDPLDTQMSSKLDALVKKRGERLSLAQRNAMLMLCELERDYFRNDLGGSASVIPTHIAGKPIPEWLKQRMSLLPHGASAVEIAEIRLDVLRDAADGDKDEVDRLHRFYFSFNTQSCAASRPEP